MTPPVSTLMKAYYDLGPEIAEWVLLVYPKAVDHKLFKNSVLDYRKYPHYQALMKMNADIDTVLIWFQNVLSNEKRQRLACFVHNNFDALRTFTDSIHDEELQIRVDMQLKQGHTEAKAKETAAFMQEHFSIKQLLCLDES